MAVEEGPVSPSRRQTTSSTLSLSLHCVSVAVVGSTAASVGKRPSSTSRPASATPSASARAGESDLEGSTGTAVVTVPDVRGQTAGSAVAELRSAGFTPEPRRGQSRQISPRGLWQTRHRMQAGIVLKGMNTRYLTGYRGWTKIRRRDTIEAIIGAVTGTSPAPVFSSSAATTRRAGCARSAGRYRCAPGVSRKVGEYLAAAGPGHPGLLLRGRGRPSAG
ncbi:PASTA domain-containing protein [Streptomyces sp. NPDC048603]|uniref:PASTA domain-containing protein n=1 Tax=Streptomyces sp. NPDC048603 TaxID=3365577 RepID=UPI003721C479